MERMKCVVTAGPTYEPLDEVRRLTNFSTGKLGSLLANHLARAGHDVTLLLGDYATYSGTQESRRVLRFGTTDDLAKQMESLAVPSAGVDAVYHAAAVSDFGFGKIFSRGANGDMREIAAGKLSTRDGTLLAELKPTPKIIAQLRGWFPAVALVGWKYEVDGGREDVLARAERQITDTGVDACVANGPAYGFGFGLAGAAGRWHFSDTVGLFTALEELGATKVRSGPRP
jgi:phosphopantothenoylcysteine synthetase/decarboxylase